MRNRPTACPVTAPTRTGAHELALTRLWWPCRMRRTPPHRTPQTYLTSHLSISYIDGHILMALRAGFHNANPETDGSPSHCATSIRPPFIQHNPLIPESLKVSRI